MNNFKLGIQLYTVREELVSNFKRTLIDLKQLGFEGVEFALDYGNLDPEQLAAFLVDAGLETYGIYATLDSLTDPSDSVFAYAMALNCKYLTCGIPEDVLKKDFSSCLAKLKIADKIAASKGLKLCYHAHAYEFDKFDSRNYIDIILKETNLLFEADTAWIHAGGENIKSYLEKYKDKIHLLHIKDMTKDLDYIELGAGVIDFDDIIDFACTSKVKWLGYEQDFSKIGEMQSARKSISFIKNRINKHACLI